MSISYHAYEKHINICKWPFNFEFYFDLKCELWPYLNLLKFTLTLSFDLAIDLDIELNFDLDLSDLDKRVVDLFANYAVAWHLGQV